MELGFSTMGTDMGITPQTLAEALEERGFAAMWVGEHTHIPVDSVPPYGRPGPLPETYRRMLDPFVALTAAAVVTKSITIGTNVLLINERDPLVLAKETSSLDWVSGGRFVLGVGVGWNRQEYENHTDVPWSQRYRLMRDRVSAVRALWTNDEAAYHGVYTKFGSAFSFPKPVQKPHPPVLVGGVGPLAIAHTVEWGDGWAPLVSSYDDFDIARKSLMAEATRQGRDLSTVQMMVSLRGSPDLGDLQRFREAGVSDLHISGEPTMSELEVDVMRRLDVYAAMIPRLR